MIDPSKLQRAQERLSLGRAFCAHRAPYVNTTLYGLIPHFTDNTSVPTMGVTKGLVLIINIDWFLSEPTFDGQDGHEYVGACLMHEVQHVQRDLSRLERLTEAEPQHADLVNAAADLAINDPIIDAGWKLPPWVEMVAKYGFQKGLPLETYFQELKKYYEKHPRPKQKICCGGIAGNPGDKKLESDLDHVIGRLPMDVENIKYTTNQKIRDHVKGRGTAPGFYIEELEFEAKPTVIPWERTIHHVTRRVTGNFTSGHGDYTFQRMNRRSVALRTLRPANVTRRPEVFFVRDTSGSMSDEDLNTANNEMISCMRSCGIDEVTYVDVDVVMHGEPKRVRTRDIPALKAKGRGGTSFVQVLKYIEKMKKKPDIVIYLTDGYGTAPKRKPKGFTTIWCLIPSGGNCTRPAPWGNVVVCSNDMTLRRRIERQFDDFHLED